VASSRLQTLDFKHTKIGLETRVFHATNGEAASWSERGLPLMDKFFKNGI